MPDLEREYREAKKQLADFEKRIKSLEQRMDRQYDETEKIRKRLDDLESGSETTPTTN